MVFFFADAGITREKLALGYILSEGIKVAIECPD